MTFRVNIVFDDTYHIISYHDGYLWNEYSLLGSYLYAIYLLLLSDFRSFICRHNFPVVYLHILRVRHTYLTTAHHTIDRCIADVHMYVRITPLFRWQKVFDRTSIYYFVDKRSPILNAFLYVHEYPHFFIYFFLKRKIFWPFVARWSVPVFRIL